MSASDFDTEFANNGLTSTTSLDKTNTGWKVFVGYRMMDYLAIEGAYTDFGKATARSTITSPGAGTVTTDIESDSWTLSGLGILPINDSFSIFARLGVNFWNVDASAAITGTGISVKADDDDTGWVYGVGGAYNFTKQLGLRAEWERYDFDDGDGYDLLSVGLSYSF